MTEPIRVVLEDDQGTTLEFEPGTPPEVIQSTVDRILGVSRHSQKAPEKQTSLADVAMNLGQMALNVSPLRSAERLAGAFGRAGYELGGKATDVATSAGAPPEVAAGIGTAANLGVTAFPMAAGGAGSKAALDPALKAGARYAMGSALKAPKGAYQSKMVATPEYILEGDAARAIDTMLKHGINVTPGGAAKLREMINVLRSQVDDAIKASSANVNKAAVTDDLRNLLDDVYKVATPQKDIKIIERAWTRFLNHPLLAGKSQFPVQLANEMKRATYKSLGDKAYSGSGELKAAEIEAQKMLARGLMKEIERVVPQVKAPNKEMQELLNAEALNIARVYMEHNKNIGGLTWLAPKPGQMMLFAADRSPFFKSLLARGLYGARHGSALPGAAAGAAYAQGDLQEGLAYP